MQCDWFKAVVKTHWGSHKLLTNHRNFQHMAAILPVSWPCSSVWSFAVCVHVSLSLQESSSAHPRLHSVWPLVISAVRHGGHFGTFWKTVVDGTYSIVTCSFVTYISQETGTALKERDWLGYELVPFQDH